MTAPTAVSTPAAQAVPRSDPHPVPRKPAAAGGATVPQSSLFRRQVVAAVRDDGLGVPGLKTPRWLRLVSTAAGLLVTALALLLAFGSYARHETVPGFVRPAQGMVRMFPPRPGQVSQILTAQGSHVKKGQLLVVLASPRHHQASTDLNEEIARELRAEQASIEELITTHATLARAETLELERQLDSGKERLANLTAQSEHAREQLELGERRVRRLLALGHAGHVARNELETARMALLDSRMKLGALERQRLAFEEEMVSRRERFARRESKAGLQVLQLRARQHALARQLIENSGQTGFSLHAPVSGHVSNLLAHVGLNVRPDQPLLVLTPDDQDYQVELLAPANAIGFVQPGQTVALRYEAFPYQTFGTFSGIVETISASPAYPGEWPAPIRPAGPVFRITVRPQHQVIDTAGHSFALRPGMTLEAELLQERRRLLEWLIEPLRRAGA